jgi:hypothetical protein
MTMIKRLALYILLSLLPSPLMATLAVVQAANNLSTAATATTITVTTTSGNLLVILAAEGANNTATVTISDSASQTWTQVGGYISPNTSSRTSMWYIPNSASVTSITATWSNNPGSLSTTVRAVMYEISGAATASPLETSNTSSSASVATTLTTGAITTSNANDILIDGTNVGANQGTTWSTGAGFTLPSNSTNDRVAMSYQVVSATQSSIATSISWTSTATSCVSIFAAFKASSGGAASAGANTQRKRERIDD